MLKLPFLVNEASRWTRKESVFFDCKAVLAEVAHNEAAIMMPSANTDTDYLVAAWHDYLQPPSHLR